MLVTCDVSHAEMWPYVTSAAALSESHAATAVLMLSLSRGAAAAAAARHSMHPKDAFILRKAAGLPWMGSPDSPEQKLASVCRRTRKIEQPEVEALKAAHAAFFAALRVSEPRSCHPDAPALAAASRCLPSSRTTSLPLAAAGRRSDRQDERARCMLAAALDPRRRRRGSGRAPSAPVHESNVPTRHWLIYAQVSSSTRWMMRPSARQ